MDVGVPLDERAQSVRQSVWSRRRDAGVNAPGGDSQGATEAKEPFSGESAL